MHELESKKMFFIYNSDQMEYCRP